MAVQLSLFECMVQPDPVPKPVSPAPAHSPQGQPAGEQSPVRQSGCRRRRRRIPHPRAAAHALALQHLDLADAIAGNFARRTIHPFEDLRQVAIIGLLKAAERFKPTGDRPFRPYARTYANGEIIHYLRDCGFSIKVPPTWRDQFASGRKLLRHGVPPSEVPRRLGISDSRWLEIQEACGVTVVALQPES